MRTGRAVAAGSAGQKSLRKPESRGYSYPQASGFLFLRAKQLAEGDSFLCKIFRVSGGGRDHLRGSASPYAAFHYVMALSE